MENNMDMTQEGHDYMITLLFIAIYKLGGRLNVNDDDIDKIRDKVLIRNFDDKDGSLSFNLVNEKNTRKGRIQ